MPMGLIVIEKSWNGADWANEYAFATDAFVGLDNATISLIGGGTTFNADNTNWADAAYAGAGSTLIQALLAFERQMTWAPVQFDRVYVSDGQKNSELTDVGPLASQFWTQGLAFGGLRSVPSGDPAGIAPGNIVAYIRRTPFTFSQRSGHLSLRGALLDADFVFSGKQGVEWTSPLLKAGYQTLITDAVDNAFLRKYFGNGASPSGEGAPVWTGIGKYRRGVQIPPQDEGDLFLVAKMGDFVVDKPRSRQMTRGRKRTP